MGLGATPQSEGLLRVRGQARLRTPDPDAQVAPRPAILGRKAVQHPFLELGCARPPSPPPAGGAFVVALPDSLLVAMIRDACGTVSSGDCRAAEPRRLSQS